MCRWCWLEHKAANRPNPLLDVLIPFSGRVMRIGVPGMGCDVRVQECRRSGVMSVAQVARGLVHVGVRSRDQPEQEGHHRSSGPEPTQHNPAMVDVALPDVKRWPDILDFMRILRACAAVLAALVLVNAHTVVFAHEVTHNGTVVALKTAKYAQPSGGAREVVELEVVVVDPKTKKPSNRVFTITDKTRILRASKPVKVADASARKDEKVAVVVDHDKPGDEAIEVRFEAAH